MKMLAGLKRPNDDSSGELEDEGRVEEDDDDDAPESEPPARGRYARGDAARELDAKIVAVAAALEKKLGRPGTADELIAGAKVPGANRNAQKQRIYKALRRSGQARLSRGAAVAAASKKAAPKARASAPTKALDAVVLSVDEVPVATLAGDALRARVGAAEAKLKAAALEYSALHHALRTVEGTSVA